MPLFRLVDEEVEAVLALTVPSHPRLTFDDTEFRDLVARAHSITLDEKLWIVAHVCRNSQADVDSFMQMLREERKQFTRMNRRFDTAVDAQMAVN